MITREQRARLIAAELAGRVQRIRATRQYPCAFAVRPPKSSAVYYCLDEEEVLALLESHAAWAELVARNQPRMRALMEELEDSPV